MTFFDTETCGFHGPIVLFQYAIDDGPITLHDVWYETIDDTLALYEAVLLESEGVVGFNLAFDWFHICQQYTTLLHLKELVGGDAIPIQNIDEYVISERKARGPNNPCLKPKAACDLMLWARKNEYQVTMRRKPIRVRRVPTMIAHDLALEVKTRLAALNKNNILGVDVRVADTKGSIKADPNGVPLSDLEIQFKSSGSLKSLAAHILCGPGQPFEGKQILIMDDIAVDRKARPKELGYCPINQKKDGWAVKIHSHIELWSFNQRARQYATDDIHYTRGLYHAFKRPALGDTDSNLACMVGAVRWRGYKVDVKAMKVLYDQTEQRMKAAPRDVKRVRKLLSAHLDEFEISQISESTNKAVLESLTKGAWESHPVAPYALAVLDSRKAAIERALYTKFLVAKRFHASFKVIGTLSSRMSGGDDLNAQGINHVKEMRLCFPLADDDLVLCGGDFDSFEVGLGDAVFDDPALRDYLLNSGRKIHAEFGSFCWGPEWTYERVLASSKTKDDRYFKAKSGLFAAFLYGGNSYTLKKKLDIEEELGQKAIDEMFRRFPKAKQHVDTTFERFCSLKQSGGIGSRIVYQEPEDFAETLLGDRRYFTLENAVIKILFELAQKLPREIVQRASEIRVIRNRPREGEAERSQTGGGACMTALYAAAFGLQGGVQRAGNNNLIQSLGARLAKELQAAIWEVQPSGVQKWLVQPMNVHDEIMCPTHPDHVDRVETIVKSKIEEFRALVPTIAMEWKKGMPTWADK